MLLKHFCKNLQVPTITGVWFWIIMWGIFVKLVNLDKIRGGIGGVSPFFSHAGLTNVDAPGMQAELPVFVSVWLFYLGMFFWSYPMLWKNFSPLISDPSHPCDTCLWTHTEEIWLCTNYSLVQWYKKCWNTDK